MFVGPLYHDENDQTYKEKILKFKIIVKIDKNYYFKEYANENELNMVTYFKKYNFVID